MCDVIFPKAVVLPGGKTKMDCLYGNRRKDTNQACFGYRTFTILITSKCYL